MEKLIKVLKKHHLMIASVESLTGGLFASELVATPSASDVYLGSIVSYANSIKQDLLKIDREVMSKYGVVSEEVATLMASNGGQILNSDVCVAFTGNAGPDTLENKDLGQVYTCIKINEEVYNFSDKLSGSRNEIRKEIVYLVKTRLIAILEEKGEL